MNRRLRTHVAVLFIYGLVSMIFIDHGASLTERIIGRGTDVFQFIWFFKWWPWALAHHQNLLQTKLVWQPTGVTLGWLTSVPVLAFMGLPITLICGPVMTYNLDILLAPVASAWFAYLLCWRIRGDTVAAGVGGFLFGFSSYEMALDLSSLNLSFTMLVPCLVWLAVARLDGEIGRFKTLLLGAPMLVCEFLISVEIVATGALIAAICWCLAWCFFPARRPGLWRLFADVAIAAPIVAAVLSPFLWSMFRDTDFFRIPSFWQRFYVAEPLNFIVPTGVTALGGRFFFNLSGHFTGAIQEQDAYIGLPLLGLLAAYARRNIKTPAGGFLLLAFLICVVFSLGPALVWLGNETPIALPWALFLHLPFIGAALPARFALFSSLVLAIIAASWIAAATPATKRWRRNVGLFICLTLLPILHPVMRLPTSAFFAPGRVQSVLGPDPRLLVLPFAIQGASSYWQQENDFGFAQTGGYLGFPPTAMQSYAAVRQLFDDRFGPGFTGDFVLFCQATRTQFIVAGPGTKADMTAMLETLHWPERKVDDVTIFTVPPPMVGS